MLLPRMLLLGLACLAAAGCSATPATPLPEAALIGSCAPRKGTYNVTFTPDFGPCGGSPYTTQTYAPTQQTPAPMGCTANDHAPSDNCTITLDEVCGSTVVRGSTVWSADGTHGDGAVSVMVLDANGNIVCEGYDSVTLVRQ